MFMRFMHVMFHISLVKESHILETLDGGRQENICHQISYGYQRACGSSEMNEVICKGTGKISWFISLILT